jgi:AbiV family abortive infection protein
MSLAAGTKLHKFERMAVLAFRNALRLHEDSIELYRLRSYPSAYALSVIAAEEIGKFLLLEDVVWNTQVNGPAEPEWEQKWLAPMLDHGVKQSRFARHAELSVIGTPLLHRIGSGELEQRKHRALYVGLPTAKRKLNVRGRIMSPHTVKRRTAEEQITLVNDFVIVFAAGVVFETMGTDLAAMESILTLRLANRLMRRWPKMGRRAHRYLDQLEALDREEASKARTRSPGKR